MWLYNILGDISWGIMSSYNYQAYAPEERHSKVVKPKLKSVPRKKTKPKNPFWKIIALLLMLYFIAFPTFKKIYEYSFINHIRNLNIKVDANKIFKKAETLFANTGLFNRNFIGIINYN